MSKASMFVRRLRLPLIAALLGCALIPAEASLKAGTKAPDFSTQASLGGVVSNFSLADALKQGPVVLYFFPAAFTSGCTVEAHDFAEAIEQFKALGATVVGVSQDDIATLNRFSVSECRNKFAVAADPEQKISKAYDVTLWYWPGHSDRTSYLIAPDGSVVYTYSALAPDGHVRNLLAALQEWRSKQKS